MSNLAFIPARSGSKGVKNKNVSLIKGVPLLEFTVYTAIKAKEAGIVSDVLKNNVLICE